MCPFQNDVLQRMGKIIGYTQVYLFTILFMYSGHFTFRTSVCSSQPDSSSFNDACMGIVVLTLAMLVLSFGLAMGISMRQPNYLYPWLIMCPISVCVILVYLIVYGNLYQSIVGSIILFIMILSWYPTHKLYRRYVTECYGRCERLQVHGEVEANCPLQRTSIVDAIVAVPAPSVAHNSSKALCENPPSYDDVMAIEMHLPLCSGEKDVNLKVVQ